MKRKMKRLNAPIPRLAIPSWIMGRLTDDVDCYDLNKVLLTLKEIKNNAKIKKNC
jgi:hypothetical protein